MKAILVATAILATTTLVARAAEEYPTPIARPITSSVPVQDVGGGGAWSKTVVVTGSAGYGGMTGSESMPAFSAPAQPAPTAIVQHGATTPHG